ncbi:MAG: hypothetical protein JXR96_18035 [Deltaproteobacteria bacterium]|nr:hypothetical protein [Deltaproteobacteria bacterium]
MRGISKRWRILCALLVLGLLAGLVSAFLLQGCDGEECLVWGENCTQQYKLDNYGTTEIYCCEGQCDDHGSGVLTCGV